MEASRRTYLETLSGISQLPRISVINKALQLLGDFQESTKKAGCIYWPGYPTEYLTKVDLAVLKELSMYVTETKRQLRMEDSVSRKKIVKPIGMPDLTDKFEKAKSEIWNMRVVEPNLEPEEGLENELTSEELIQNAMESEQNNMFESKRLNTESLQKMFDSKGYLTCEAAGYFCRLLQEQYPESKFIHLNQCLSKSRARVLHATEINIRNSTNVHFIFNRSQKKVFDDSALVNLGHHWAVASIMSSGRVFFGDGLYRNIPNNLKEVLNDYYKMKFNKIIEKIENLSNKKSFPKQEDGHLCGFIAIMNLTILEDERVLEFFESNKSILKLDIKKFLIVSPSSYGIYLRQIIMSAYSEGAINRRMFITDECMDTIINVLSSHNKAEVEKSKGYQAKFKPVSSRSASRPKVQPIIPKTAPKQNRFNILEDFDNPDIAVEVTGLKSGSATRTINDVEVEDIGSDREAEKTTTVHVDIECSQDVVPQDAVPQDAVLPVPKDVAPQDVLPQDDVPLVPQDVLPEDAVPPVPQDVVPQDAVPPPPVRQHVAPQYLVPHTALPEDGTSMIRLIFFF